MGFTILSVDLFEMTGLELLSVLKDLDVNIINVKDINAVMNILDESALTVNAVVWTANSDDGQDFRDIAKIKGDAKYKDIPVLIISKFTDKKFIIKAIELGATEFIAKPYDEDTILRKICTVLKIPQSIKINAKSDEDIITFSFDEMLSRELKAASRGSYPLSVMLVVLTGKGCDNSCNDVEELAELLNKVIRTKLRETDVSFHYGSDTLLILLPFADKTGAEVVAKKIREIFDSHSVIRQKNKGSTLITASVTFPEDGRIKSNLLDKLFLTTTVK